MVVIQSPSFHMVNGINHCVHSMRGYSLSADRSSPARIPTPPAQKLFKILGKICGRELKESEIGLAAIGVRRAFLASPGQSELQLIDCYTVEHLFDHLLHIDEFSCFC
jgi:hypothetical protein